MAKRISKTKIVRKPGYLYYLAKDGYVWGVPMKSNKTGKKYKAGTEKVERTGRLCWVGKEGYVETK